MFTTVNLTNLARRARRLLLLASNDGDADAQIQIDDRVARPTPTHRKDGREDTVGDAASVSERTTRESGSHGGSGGQAPLALTDAFYVYWFFIHWNRWVFRRTETISFIDQDHVRRRQTVDCQPSRAEKMFQVGPSAMPIAVLRKVPLRNFDLTDASQTSLPAFTLEQNSALATEALMIAASGVVGWSAEPEGLRDLIADIVGGDSNAAPEALRQLEERDGRVDHAVLTQLAASEDFMPVARTLARNFLLVLKTPATADERVLIKFGYDERLDVQHATEVPVTSDAPVPGSWRRLKESMKRKLRIETVAKRLALDPHTWVIPCPGTAAAESYHVEIDSPDDLIIERAELRDSKTRQRLCNAEISTDRAHLTARHRNRSSSADAVVTFRVRSSRVLRAARNISLVTTVVLLGGLALHFFSDIPANGGVASALLVALPGIFAAYIARPNQHRLAEQLVSGVRGMIAIEAILSFLAAGALAVGMSTDQRVGTWLFCAAISLVITAITWIGDHRSSNVEKATR